MKPEVFCSLLQPGVRSAIALDAPNSIAHVEPASDGDGIDIVVRKKLLTSNDLVYGAYKHLFMPKMKSILLEERGWTSQHSFVVVPHLGTVR